ncbi:SUMF1/EgtB/PvdO family nonheme iron enzyme [Acidiphilium sp. JA12-A1]|uniref:SUMF1/EgtB/PvdO family nonheme iron enzyme n=1 Tax=Acidiphilium sp. JA12-A1 TaxID=1464546 RepID=UPI000460B25C|nr:SUMF1/EgtB/PvdO family nonheme iron enzyme [Acidiphilium sp. JA12-A1]KDM68400.1 sulfatase-modifying factor enzyme 1 [Acidiphilium sp. JA12-A1]
MIKQSEPTTAFLPLQPGRRFVPIRGFSPDEIKGAAKISRTSQHSDGDLNIGHNKAINQILKALGFVGDIAAFKVEYESRLNPFIERSGLVQRSGAMFEPASENFFRLNRSQVAGRIFASDRTIPRRVFAGAEVEVWEFLEAARSLSDVKIGCRHQGHFGSLWNQPFEQRVAAAIDPQHPPFSYFIQTPATSLEVCEISEFFNLIGGQLMDFGSDGDAEISVATIYNQGRPLTPAEEQDHRAKGDLLRRIVRQIDAGWIDILPYNDRLAFLRGPAGLYDFVFAHQREEEFIRRPYASAMPQDRDVERTADENFKEWLYFSYQGWEEHDRRRAVMEFYRAGGTRAEYRSQAVLRSYLAKAGTYQDVLRQPSPASRIVNGIPIAPAARPTRLIESREFHYFLRRNRSYAARRLEVSDALSDADTDPDSRLPAAVTWFDAIAYVDWARKETGRNVQLLTEAEYLEAAGDLIPEDISDADIRNALSEPLYDFVGPDGSVRAEKPPYMPQDEFAKWRLEYKPSVESHFATSMHGLHVLQSFWFGEWLEPEGAAINSLFFCSQYDVTLAGRIRVSAGTAPFAPNSTGKYKGMKIGFRIVYRD